MILYICIQFKNIIHIYKYFYILGILGQTNVDVEKTWLPVPKMIQEWWNFHIYVSLLEGNQQATANNSNNNSHTSTKAQPAAQHYQEPRSVAGNCFQVGMCLLDVAIIRGPILRGAHGSPIHQPGPGHLASPKNRVNGIPHNKANLIQWKITFLHDSLTL